MTGKAKKVVVGMSGGVDSAVAAYILKEQGYDVVGVTMQVWQAEDRETIEDNGGCCGLSAVEDARRIAGMLDIPYYVLNFRDIFKEKVIDYFIKEYAAGRTPNPCIACNRYVKWESLLMRATQLGADFISTGHYAKISIHPKTGRHTLTVSATSEKDQTYALYNLTQDQLKKTLMPIGEFTKPEVREIAKKIGLPVADKPDSQEICFIPDNNYGKYISEEGGIDVVKGNFVDTEGKILGTHKGICHYTIGQRKGLGISFGKPMFVKKIDILKNEVILAENDELYGDTLYADEVSLMSFEDIKEPVRLRAKIRYAHKPADCVATMDNGILKCVFDTPQRAITPGQAVVLYDGEYVAGGGTINQ